MSTIPKPIFISLLCGFRPGGVRPLAALATRGAPSANPARANPADRCVRWRCWCSVGARSTTSQHHGEFCVPCALFCVCHGVSYCPVIIYPGSVVNIWQARVAEKIIASATLELIKKERAPGQTHETCGLLSRFCVLRKHSPGSGGAANRLSLQWY